MVADTRTIESGAVWELEGTVNREFLNGFTCVRRRAYKTAWLTLRYSYGLVIGKSKAGVVH